MGTVAHHRRARRRNQRHQEQSWRDSKSSKKWGREPPFMTTTAGSDSAVPVSTKSLFVCRGLWEGVRHLWNDFPFCTEVQIFNFQACWLLWMKEMSSFLLLRKILWEKEKQSQCHWALDPEHWLVADPWQAVYLHHLTSSGKSVLRQEW